MKRNLLSILILALLIVNLGMNGFLLFNVMSTNSKSAKLIGDISAAIELEKSGGLGGGGGADFSNLSVAFDDRIPYTLTTQQNFPLKVGADGKAWVVQTGVEIVLNQADENYKTYGTEESLGRYANSILNVVQTAFGSYEIEEIRMDQSALKQSILQGISAMYEGSTMVIDVNFPGWTPAEM